MSFDNQVQVFSDHVVDLQNREDLKGYYTSVYPPGNVVLCTNPPSKVFTVVETDTNSFTDNISSYYPDSLVTTGNELTQDVNVVDIAKYYTM